MQIHTIWRSIKMTRFLRTEQRRHGLTKMDNKYMYVAKPNAELNLNRKKKCCLGLSKVNNKSKFIVNFQTFEEMDFNISLVYVDDDKTI
ncbi:hypothetical protein ACLKA7_013653 [Drosophila subpalustris]